MIFIRVPSRDNLLDEVVKYFEGEQVKENLTESFDLIEKCPELDKSENSKGGRILIFQSDDDLVNQESWLKDIRTASKYLILMLGDRVYFNEDGEVTLVSQVKCSVPTYLCIGQAPMQGYKLLTAFDISPAPEHRLRVVRDHDIDSLQYAYIILYQWEREIPVQDSPSSSSY